MLNNIRIEEDLLGTREVPADAYYGVHTLRAIENFYISNSKISDIPEFVRGMVMVLVLHFHAFGEEMAAAASLPNIVVRLFGVEALWVACVIGYLACFASLNIYIQSFARLVWSQAQHKPHSYLARLSPRQIPRNALNAVLGSCVVSTLGIYLLDINLDALIVYANGIFIMIYLLCMLAGCRLLRGRYRLLAVVGSILCLLLLAMVGWKSLYALVMLAGLWLFLPRRKLATGSA
ncbi:permease [Klebsiella pneumoniae]|nr:permease [Klebsiella pneumoniae]